LVAADRSVTVLEARDRVAGRNFGGVLSNGVPVELGGQWVGPTQDAVLELIDELGLETFPQHVKGESLTVFDGNLVRYSDETFGLPLESAMEVGRLLELLESMAVTVNLEAPWETADAAVLDSQTLDTWIVANTEDPLARRLFRLVVPGVFSAESPELSLLHFLFYVKSGTSMACLVSAKGGAQDSRVVGGTHQISERMAAALGDRVRLGAVVRTIRHDDDGVTVEYEGGSVSAKRVVVAIRQARHPPPRRRRRSYRSSGQVSQPTELIETSLQLHSALAGQSPVFALGTAIGFHPAAVPAQTAVYVGSQVARATIGAPRRQNSADDVGQVGAGIDGGPSSDSDTGVGNRRVAWQNHLNSDGGGTDKHSRPNDADHFSPSGFHSDPSLTDGARHSMCEFADLTTGLRLLRDPRAANRAGTWRLYSPPQRFFRSVSG
jgi:hypothetical protein